MPKMPTVIDPTPEMIKKWGDTRTALIWHAPAFTHIFYTMMNKSHNEHIAYFVPDVPKEHPEHVPVAATDGAHMLINPVTYFKYTLMERVFVGGHEIVHNMCGHVELMHKLAAAGKVSYPDGKSLAFDADVLNRAMDYFVNDLLIESKIGTYNTDWLWDKNIGTCNDDVLTIYRRIYQAEMGDGQGKGGSGAGSTKNQKQNGFDKHMEPGSTTGKDAGQAVSERSDIEWKTAIAGAMAAAKAQGKLPAALERVMGKEIEPEVDWSDKVQAFFARKVGNSSYDWRRADRRFMVRGIVTPARSGFGCGDIVVGVDTSGSIGEEVLTRFFAEMGGILENLRPRRLFVMWCDAKVNRVDELNDGTDLYTLRGKKAPGGGGTSFVPVFDKIDELDIEPDALIYLTDGLGTFPKDVPSYPVLWGNIEPKSKYPFGDVINVPT